MKELGQYKTYTLTLTTLSPLFIGSGKDYSKTDYIFNARNRSISVIDTEALFSFLVKNRLEDDYEKFVLGNNTDMNRFLREQCALREDELQKLFLYTVDSSYVLDENHSLKSIQAFQRDSRNKAYIPGSSLKGVLRTVLLFSMIRDEGITHSPVKLEPNDRRAEYIKESQYLSVLNFEKSKKKDDKVSDIMRGLAVSDSNPIDNSDFVLGAKVDLDTKGDSHQLNVVRECVKPGTCISFSLTLDNSVLHDRITKESIEKSIQDFSDYYYDNYIYSFRKNNYEAELSTENVLYFGGGCGYFSKTLTYPYYGEENALRMVSDFFVRGKQTSKHKHEDDVNLGISPHMLKYTNYLGRLYPMGVCEVSIK